MIICIHYNTTSISQQSLLGGMRKVIWSMFTIIACCYIFFLNPFNEFFDMSESILTLSQVLSMYILMKAEKLQSGVSS